MPSHDGPLFDLIGELIPTTLYVMRVSVGDRKLICTKKVYGGLDAVQARSFRDDWVPFRDDRSEVMEIQLTELLELVMSVNRRGIEVVGFVVDDSETVHRVHNGTICQD